MSVRTFSVCLRIPFNDFGETLILLREEIAFISVHSIEEAFKEYKYKTKVNFCLETF